MRSVTRQLRADDKRRTYHKTGIKEVSASGNGVAKRVKSVFHDRRGTSLSNGRGKKAS